MLPLHLIIASLVLVTLALVLARVLLLVDRCLIIAVYLDLRILAGLLLWLMKVICTATKSCILL